MSDAKRVARAGDDGGEKTTGGAETIAAMFVAAPLPFVLLLLFLAALAIPAKIFNPKARILR